MSIVRKAKLVEGLKANLKNVTLWHRKGRQNFQKGLIFGSLLGAGIKFTLRKCHGHHFLYEINTEYCPCAT